MAGTAAVPLAAAFAPSLVGAFSKRPKSPSYQYTGPDRSAYINQLLESSFNPNDRLYQLAADQASETINRTLANRGLMDSSLGLQQVRTGSADLANRFLEGELERRRSALGTAREFDALRAGVDMNRYNSERNAYDAAMEEKKNLVGGIASAIGTGYGLYNQQQLMNDSAANSAAWRRLLTESAPTPSFAPFTMPAQSGQFGLGR